MKKLLLIILPILSFMTPTVLYAEIYECAYLYDGEAKAISYERIGNLFVHKGIEDPIVFEDKYTIVLSHTYRKVSTFPPSTFTTLIDKEKLNFVYVGIEFENSTAIVEGKCNVYK